MTASWTRHEIVKKSRCHKVLRLIGSPYIIHAHRELVLSQVAAIRFLGSTCSPNKKTLIPTRLVRKKMAAILADDNLKCSFVIENDRNPIRIPLKFVSRSTMDNKPAFVQAMAWRRTGDTALPEPLLPSLLTHICDTRGRCVNPNSYPIWLTGSRIWDLEILATATFLRFVLAFSNHKQTISYTTKKVLQ